MKKLVVICQKVDETDDLLGFFVGWLKEFAKHYDKVEVITLAKGEYWLPNNVTVHSLGKERGTSKLFWLPRMKWLLLKHTKGASGVFCHMSPVFALVAWPFTRLYGAKLVLWFLHRSVTLKLKLAVRLVDRLVTADKDSLNIQSDKIVETGHGIDIERFEAGTRSHPSTGKAMHILSVGRLSPIKDFGTLIRAAAILKERDKRIKVRIVGRPVMQADHDYAQELKHLVGGLGLNDTIEFIGFVPYRNMPVQYAWADVIVGGTPTGGLDKAILEGMASGCVPFVANEAMKEHLGSYSEELLYMHGDAESLAEKILKLDDYDSISRESVALVRKKHSLPQVIERIVPFL